MSDKQRPVILLSGGSTTAPLASHLVNDFDLAILDQANAQAQAQRYGDKVVPVLTRIGEKEQQAALSAATRLTLGALAGGAPAVAGQIEQLPGWEPFRGNGLAKDMDTWLPGYLYASLQRQIARNDALDALVKERKVAMCVTHEDVTEWFGGLTQWAKTRGIPTMHVPHANSYMVNGYGPDLHDTSICDYLAATPHMQEFYCGRGYKGSTRLTGSPLFDKWQAVDRDREWARRSLKLDLNRPVVVYASSWGQRTNANDDLERFEVAINAMLDAAALRPGWQLVIKMHPGEQQGIEQAYGQAAQRAGVPCIVTRFYLELVLAAADVMVALGPSNVLIDAALMNVPGVCMSMPGFDVGHSAIPTVEPDPDQLVNAVDHAFSAEGQARWAAERGDLVYRNAYKPDGKAALRVAQWIKEMAS